MISSIVDALINICIYLAISIIIFSPIVWLVGFVMNIKEGAKAAIKEANTFTVFGTMEGISKGLTLAIIWLFVGKLIFNFTHDALYFHSIFIIGIPILGMGLFAIFFGDV